VQLIIEESIRYKKRRRLELNSAPPLKTHNLLILKHSQNPKTAEYEELWYVSGTLHFVQLVSSTVRTG
jgi:hypothetical protein